MYTRIFSAKIDNLENEENKPKPEISVEWRQKLSALEKKQLIQIHVAAFLDLYRNYTEKQLELDVGLTKKVWLTEMIGEEIKDIEAGEIFLAAISIDDNLAGFASCLPVKYRFDKSAGGEIMRQWLDCKKQEGGQWQESFRTDIFISLLAVKPIRNERTHEKIRIGLGRQLLETVEKRFIDANAMVLDTRLINEPGIAFYTKLGFTTTGKRTFGGANPCHYTGCEKVVIRPQ